MKKFLFITAMLAIATLSNAQVELGIKAGYNSSLTFDNANSVINGSYDLESVESEMWNNLQAGLFARIALGEKFFLQPEFLYSVQKKNYQVNFWETSPSENLKLDNHVKLSSLEVPILFGVKLLDLKVLSLHAIAGPKLKFNAGSTLEYENVVGGTVDKNKITDEIKAAQLGFEVGLGLDISKFILNVRYSLIDDMYTTKFKDVQFQNLPSKSLVISLGWKLF